MYCKNCGTKLNEGDKVCSKCNTPVVSNNTTQSSGKNPFLQFLKHELILLGIVVTWFVFITVIILIINLTIASPGTTLRRHPSATYNLIMRGVFPFLQIIIPVLGIVLGWIPILIYDIVKNN